MKLKWQIYILSSLIFVLCAISFGLLHYDMRYEQSKLAYKNKITSLLISVGAFAKIDTNFVCEKNISKLIARAELESLEISKMQAKHRIVLENNPEITEENYTLKATYTSGNFILRASLVQEDTQVLKDSFWYIIAYWIAAGLFLGLIAAYIIFRFLNAKIKLLENKLFEETNSRIEILEFKDLMFSAKLLKESNTLKKEKEYYKLQSKEVSSKLSAKSFQKINKHKDTTLGKYKFSFEIANNKALNSFYAKVSDNLIFYGKINSELGELESLSNCILARDYAKSLLEKQSEELAYNQLCELFDLEIFNTIKLEGDSLLHKTFTKNGAKQEKLSFDKSLLLSTQKEHKEIAIYTKLNFENAENKLKFILKLLPENTGGLYILIES